MLEQKIFDCAKHYSHDQLIPYQKTTFVANSEYSIILGEVLKEKDLEIKPENYSCPLVAREIGLEAQAGFENERLPKSAKI